MKNIFAILTLSLLMFSCSEPEVNGLSVEDYIAENNLTTRELDDGVHIIIHSIGNDNRPNINSRVITSYVGKLTNGEVFDSNTSAEFNLFGLIKGWQIGLKEIGENGSCTLIIPSEAGFGSTSTGGIPANSTLIFECTLLEIIL